MKRILVAGELNVDLVITGLPSLPVLGQELICTGFHKAMGSSSAITAARLAALGATVDFVGLVGDDDYGRFVISELGSFGVGTDYVQIVADTPTDVTLALTYEHDRALLTYPGLMITFDGSAITPDFLARYAHLHVGSFFLQKALQPALPGLFRMAHDAGMTTSLDTGWDPDERWMKTPHLASTLGQTDFFFPNDDEVAALLGGKWDPARLAECVHGTLVIKRGAEGAIALRNGETPVEYPAMPVEVIDTTGAGDAFNAGFIYATILQHAALDDALRFAIACGSQAVTEVGGATNAPSAAALHAWLKTIEGS